MAEQQPADSPLLPCFGIVGGIGSGKSAVARWVVSQDPSLRLFDADRAGHQVLEQASVQERLRNAFGDAIFLNNGKIDRPHLAALVFEESPKGAERRRTLEAIVHPAIEALRDEAIREWASAGDVRAVIVDAALLLEAGWSRHCVAVIFVDASEAVRRERVLSRGWSADELARREMSQWPLPEKKKAADFIVDNNGGLDIAGRQVYEYIQQTLPMRGPGSP